MKPGERILSKLESCRTSYLRLIELRAALAKPEVDPVVWAAAERFLQVCIERAIDVGEMVISWKRLPRPEENRQVFLVLAEAGLLDASLAQRLARAAGLRNLLVHQYSGLDPARIRKAVLQDLPDLEAFYEQASRLALT